MQDPSNASAASTRRPEKRPKRARNNRKKANTKATEATSGVPKHRSVTFFVPFVTFLFALPALKSESVDAEKLGQSAPARYARGGFCPFPGADWQRSRCSSDGSSAHGGRYRHRFSPLYPQCQRV